MVNTTNTNNVPDCDCDWEDDDNLPESNDGAPDWAHEVEPKVLVPVPTHWAEILQSENWPDDDHNL